MGILLVIKRGQDKKGKTFILALFIRLSFFKKKFNVH